MASKKWDGDGVPLAESNCEGLGGAEDKALRKSAAKTEPAWQGAGEQAGLLIWRVENFEVKAWDPHSYGKFYKGDSYIVLETAKRADSDVLDHHIYFWLGESSSIDEMGTAAYKTVELSDLLDGAPTQSREVMRQESRQFKKLFSKLQYLEGGVESGFHHVGMIEFKPKLLQVHKGKHGVHSHEVKCSRESMNHGDCYVLDAGTKIWEWMGQDAGHLVKYEAAMLAQHLESERPHGHATIMHEIDDDFWSYLGGEGPIKSCSDATAQEKDLSDGVLLRIEDTHAEELKVTEVARDSFKASMLDSKHVMMLDHETEICLWVGEHAPAVESRNAFRTAMKYLSQHGRDANIAIHMYKEGHEIRNPVWVEAFDEGKVLARFMKH